MSGQREQTADASAVVAEASAAGSGAARARNLILDNLIWVILAATFAVGSLIQGFLSVDNLINVTWAAVPMGCMVLGMFFVMLTGGLDLSLESIYGVSPVIAIVVMNDLPAGTPPLLAVPMTLLVGLLAGLLNGFISVRLRVNPFLVTLATLLFWRGVVIALIPEGIYQLPDGYTLVGGLRFFDTVPLAIFIGAALFIVAYVLASRTAFGKAVYAVGSNEMAAFVAGIRVSRVKIAVFVIAGGLAAIGGLIEVGRIGAVVSDLGQNQIMMVFAGTILGGTSLAGGRGRIVGVLAAVFELALIENVMNLNGVEPSLRQMFFALILLGAIYLASFQEHHEAVKA